MSENLAIYKSDGNGNAAEVKYLLHTAGRGWWLAGGFGYTDNQQEAGTFTVNDLVTHNLDLVTLHKVIVV